MSGKGEGKFRIALVGSGRIAQSYLAAFKTSDQLELVALVDTNAETLKAAVEAYPCRGYADHRAMLEKEKPDGVVVCVPPVLHPAIAEDCLNAGAHVLCEKPLAIRVEQVEAMQAAAARHGRQLMMASKFRYVKDIASARSLIQAGILGQVVHFENTFSTWLDVTRRWNSDPEVAGGGVLIDNGTHSVDIARYMLGPIREVLAVHGPQIQPIKVEDTSHLIFRNANKVVGAIDVSWSLPKEKSDYIEVFGTEGILQIGWKTSRYRQVRSSEWVQFGTGYNKQDAFEAQIRNFIGVARGLEAPLITPLDALASVRVIEAAYQSAALNAWVEVAP